MKGIVLLIVATIITLVMAPVGIVFGFYKKFYKTSFKKAWKDVDMKLINMAVSIDKFGNVMCSELLNATLIKNSEMLFGNHRQTISNVIGRNLQAGTLTACGKFLNKVLDMLDKNHSIESIELE